MKCYNQPVEIIIRQATAAPKAKSSILFSNEKAMQKQLEAAGIPVHLVKRTAVPHFTSFKSKYKAAIPENVYAKTKINDIEVNPWDVAHMARTALKDPYAFVEPD